MDSLRWLRPVTALTPHGIMVSRQRLYRACPPILLGTLFNVLDAVSTGLLIFPSDSQTFETVQIQGISMYIMRAFSTVLSQIVMTLGGSQFSGGLGAMLIEILPFLRGIGSDIQHSLGDDNPALIPTVMVAYALTSFLIGILFIALGVCKAGRWVAYFPKTVLTGIIGGIGVSLFILGLGLPFPASTPILKLSSAGRILFATNHIGLLAASCVPALFLSFSLRSNTLKRVTRGGTSHAYYVPLFFLFQPIVFWIVVTLLHKANATGMASLVIHGWLFKTNTLRKDQTSIGISWDYWQLFNFTKVEPHAFKDATTNIILVVVIGVLNLPIYVPAMCLSLKTKVDANHEFIGQGVANIFAGIAGAPPNILVGHNRAGGGRLEAGVVTALMVVFFFVASKILPYVPTVLASSLVLFLGIELTFEAIWETAKTSTVAEWLVMMTTLIACTFLGFAPGFGIGIGAAILLYAVTGALDTRATSIKLDEETNTSTSQETTPWASVAGFNLEICPTPKQSISIELQEIQPKAKDIGNLDRRSSASINVIALKGHVFFATIPSLEAKLAFGQSDADVPCIIDMTQVHRLDTSAVECLESKLRERTDGEVILFAGIMQRSPAIMDLQRGGVSLNFTTRYSRRSCVELSASASLAFEDYDDAVRWCQDQGNNIIQRAPKEITGSISDPNFPIISQTDAFQNFCDSPQTQDILHRLMPSFVDSVTNDHYEPPAALSQFQSRGGSIGHYQPGSLIGLEHPRFIFVLQGQICFEELKPSTREQIPRLSILELFRVYGQAAFASLRSRSATRIGDFAPSIPSRCTVGTGQSVTVVSGLEAKGTDAKMAQYGRPGWELRNL
ncbi:MAG: hypothetical protein Q9186_001918 [Xanthomendoza sp. 1 TL-2023]